MAHDLALEIAAAVLQPHFDAVRDAFLAYRADADHEGFVKLKKTKFVVDPKIRDSIRHFAACRDDGLLILFAPECVDLPDTTLVPIVAHELGHALDHLYPAEWMQGAGPGKARWIGDRGDSKMGRRWKRLWRERSRDQIEWTADGIAETVTGQKLGYCGACMLQCFNAGVERPAGLR
jgi:hypothetical protein